MKLIDKDKVVAEIKKRMQENLHENPLTASAYIEDEDLLSFIDTIEVKEVDLDREIYDYFNAWQNVLCDEDCCNEGGFCCVLDENVKPVNIARCRKIAKHFYELGLKAKLQSVFPELRETKDKDKRIGEEIIQYIKELHKFGYLLSKFSEEWIAWLEKQKPLPEGCVRKQVAEAKEALYTAEVETGDGGIKAVVTKEVSIKSE